MKTAITILYHLLHIAFLLFQPNLNLVLSAAAAPAGAAAAGAATAAAATAPLQLCLHCSLHIFYQVQFVQRLENQLSSCKPGNHPIEQASKQQSGGDLAFYEDVALINHCSSVRLRYYPLHQLFAGTSDTFPAHLLDCLAASAR